MTRAERRIPKLKTHKAFWYCNLSGYQLLLTELSRLSAHESGTIYWQCVMSAVVVHIRPATENPPLLEVISHLFPGH